MHTDRLSQVEIQATRGILSKIQSFSVKSAAGVVIAALAKKD